MWLAQAYSLKYCLLNSSFNLFREEDFVGFYAKRSGLLVCSFKSILDNFQIPTLSQNKLPYALKRRFFFVNFLKFFSLFI